MPEIDGLYQKYTVVRTDERDRPGEKHDGCEHFVLDVTHDPAAAPALIAYAQAVQGQSPGLANELRQLVMRKWPKALELTGFAAFAALVKAEVAEAERRWPDNTILHRLVALTGEVGELAEGVLKSRPAEELRREAVQVAAMAYRAAKALS